MDDTNDLDSDYKVIEQCLQQTQVGVQGGGVRGWGFIGRCVGCVEESRTGG